MADLYHAFYTVLVGRRLEYKALSELSDVLSLVAEQYDTPEKNARIGDLKVIYGQLLEFEPAEIVKSYRVKTWHL